MISVCPLPLSMHPTVVPYLQSSALILLQVTAQTELFFFTVHPLHALHVYRQADRQQPNIYILVRTKGDDGLARLQPIERIDGMG